MTAAEIARARHRLYALLGRLLVEGPTDEAMSVAAAIADNIRNPSMCVLSVPSSPCG